MPSPFRYIDGYSKLTERRYDLLEQLHYLRANSDNYTSAEFLEEQKKILSELTEIGQKIKKAHKEVSTKRYLL